MSGLEGIVRWLEARLDARRVRVEKDTVVAQVRWAPERVEAIASAGYGGAARTFCGRSAIVTFPVGVLRRPPGAPGTVAFAPDLPEKREAAGRLEMGPVIKLVLVFRDAFWETEPSATLPEGESLARLGFLISRDAHFPTWWTMLPVRAPVLTGWSAGPAAERLAGKPPEALLSRALDSLSTLLGMPRAVIEGRVRAWRLHDWQQDPFAAGAYSFVPVGALDARRKLAEPVDGTLFFAGEATRWGGESGTVAAAIATGLRAAGEALAARLPA